MKKQNGIYQKFQKSTWKPQVAYYVCSLTWMTSFTSRQSLIIQNFAIA